MASAARRELLCDAFCEYLEAAVHQLLYARGVYPRELFASFGLYGAEVFKCRHPEVAFYIHDTVASLREAIASGEVPRVAVVIHSGESGEQEGLNALERHVFEVQLGSPGQGAVREPALAVEALERHLRASLVRLQSLNLPSLPADATFQIVAYARREEQSRTVLSSTAWIEEDPELGGTELAAPAALHEPRTFAAAGLWLQTFSEVPRPD